MHSAVKNWALLIKKWTSRELLSLSYHSPAVLHAHVHLLNLRYKKGFPQIQTTVWNQACSWVSPCIHITWNQIPQKQFKLFYCSEVEARLKQPCWGQPHQGVQHNRTSTERKQKVCWLHRVYRQNMSYSQQLPKSKAQTSCILPFPILGTTVSINNILKEETIPWQQLHRFYFWCTWECL